MSLETLLLHSRRYGKDTAFVLLGGGNTSYKEGDVLYVKASGHSLATITEEGFVKMSLKKMEGIWEKQYSEDDDKREDQVLKDMMDCRLEGEKARPSVEALLHAVLPFPYVVHLHPALVNGLTCSQNGEKAFHELFPDDLWIELVKPGFTLADVVRKRLIRQKQQQGRVSNRIFLQNHGIFVGGTTLEEVQDSYLQIMHTLESRLVRKPDFSPVAYDQKRVDGVLSLLQTVSLEKPVFSVNREIANVVRTRKAFGSVDSSFTPDHIVYAGFKPLWVEDEGQLVSVFKAFRKENGVDPKIICVQELGAFSLGETPMPLFLDTVAISVYTESFGGPRFMDDAMIGFIRNWEVEKYRAKVAAP